MKKKFQMRRFGLLCVILVSFYCNAQADKDSVIMTVAGKDIPLAEFVYMAAKNKEVDLTNKKSLDAYVELFKNFKLKVADAESLGLDKASSFTKEFTRYKAELTASYMSDAKGEEEAVRKNYDRGNEVLELSYILFPFRNNVVSKDTVSFYRSAYSVYERAKNGESLQAIADELQGEEEEGKDAVYEYVNSLLPLKASKAFDNVAYALEVGETSRPVLTASGYYVIQLHKRKPNLGQVKVAHILFRIEGDDPEQERKALEKANEVRKLAIAGEDFEELAKEFSQDASSASRGGVMPFFTHGTMVSPFESAAYNLKEAGAVSEPVRTPYGYHLIKLYEKKPRVSFEEDRDRIASIMKKGEWNFEFYGAFDNRLLAEYDYKLYPEAYAELKKVCDEFFPTDSSFFKSVENLQDTLFTINNLAFTQKEFSYYLLRHPFSTKTYSCDFMKEVYDLFLRDLITAFEKENFERKHPDYKHLLQEYRDGILLFEISNARVWEHPVEEQAKLEEQWLNELREKFPVILNSKLLKKIKKH